MRSTRFGAKIAVCVRCGATLVSLVIDVGVIDVGVIDVRNCFALNGMMVQGTPCRDRHATLRDRLYGHHAWGRGGFLARDERGG